MPGFSRIAVAISLSFALCACGGDRDGDDSPASPAGSGEIGSIQITVGDLVFDALAAGPDEGEPVLLLHGFPQTFWEWEGQLPALGLAGYRAVAPNQRGYSPGARPAEVSAYEMQFLVQDVLGMADALGFDRFHLVGHDWGAAVTWAVADAAPERLLSIAPISVPHPDAFAEALADPNSCQVDSSSYFDFFVLPNSEDAFLANDAALLRGAYAGIPADQAERHVELLANKPALKAGLDWYRANLPGGRSGLLRAPVGPTTVPTMYIWSDQDFALCVDPAEKTGDFVSAPYRFEVIAGVNHWVPEIAAERVAELLLEHLAAN